MDRSSRGSNSEQLSINADSSWPNLPSGASTPSSETQNGWVEEREPLNFAFTNHAPFNKLYDISCPTPWSWVRRIASEVVLYINYGFKLLGYLGLGYKWALSLYQLIVYATLLLPGFIQVILFYFFSPRVSRSVAYGAGPRQRLDMYLTKNRKPGHKYPVVIFVTGGAWTIGYKAWGALLAKRLSQAGALVACLDYRNFPQARVAARVAAQCF
ncbi:hypothetical protein DUNSADRAFT_4985 [Dunaliella salina]|uniref:protein-S-isoprenylcysteine alpha-carbonyl methylesterase n=1 Tax=Dunaliella salina TaxID=3046 RepID=A0ABQ7GQX5_DUNSA|nr:hypothetical protein DUNSADRAFT_4985 [Dunaliella salina]|eukprot:KAF5837012.1 hypothetical protein DUNSADRAFT_4985 [Dunaliella salina]